MGQNTTFMLHAILSAVSSHDMKYMDYNYIIIVLQVFSW